MKKIFLLASIIMLCLSLAACSSGSSFRSGTSLNDSTEPSDNSDKSLSVEEMIENFEPPANIVSADMTAEDPSNDEIVFTFQEDGKIQNCVYRINGEKVMVTYGYDTMEKGQIWVLAFSEDSTVIAEESFNYSENEDSGFIEHNGYYFKNVDVSDIQ